MSSKNKNQTKGTMYQHLAGKCLPSFRKSMLIYGKKKIQIFLQYQTIPGLFSAFT